MTVFAIGAGSAPNVKAGSGVNARSLRNVKITDHLTSDEINKALADFVFNKWGIRAQKGDIAVKMHVTELLHPQSTKAEATVEIEFTEDRERD